MTAAETQAQTNSRLEQGMSRMTRGLCMAINETAGTVTVNIGGGEQSMPMLVMRPTVGWDVWVLYIGPQPFSVGPVYRSPGGTVLTAPDAGKVIISGDDGVQRTLPYSTVLELVPTDRVAVDWPNRLIIAEPAAENENVDPLPPDGGGGVERESVFYPTDSGTWGSSWFTTEVWSGDSSLGAYFYQGIADTIPDSAVISFVSVYTDAIQTSGGAPTIGLHNLASKSGAPTISSAVTVAGGTGWKDLPTSFGDALKTGAQRGLGTNHGGYHKWAPAGVRNSGTLVIRWRG